MNKYRLGQEVNWFEGRTQRQRYGLIEQVHELAGWPAEYTVRAFKKSGGLGKLTRRLYESELEAVKPDMTPDVCCMCHEPLSNMLVCNNCYSAVCVGCAQHDGAGDSYCPECWSDMQSFLAEGVTSATPESQRYDSPQCVTTLPHHRQKQLQGQN